MADLQDSEWVIRFLARHTLVTLGDEIITPLIRVATNPTSPLQSVAIWILDSIEQETKKRLSTSSSNYLCPRCLSSVGSITITAQDAAFTYYGCRICGQSRDFLEVDNVTAVLDKNWNEPRLLEGDELRVNWLSYQKIFDFNRAEIIQADDQEVERFGVQIGNDTDSKRTTRYKQMTCWVNSACDLSPNTLRILERTFGTVKLIALGKA